MSRRESFVENNLLIRLRNQFSDQKFSAQYRHYENRVYLQCNGTRFLTLRLGPKRYDIDASRSEWAVPYLRCVKPVVMNIISEEVFHGV